MHWHFDKGFSRKSKNSIFINSYFPHWLVSEADKYGGQVIHISTDCVFSGKKGGYIEADFRDADDIYGRGKALGELIGGRHLTLRTSIIGPELKSNGEGLFHWFMNQKGETNGYTKAIWGGVTTFELAKVIKDCVFKKERACFTLLMVNQFQNMTFWKFSIPHSVPS
ncbi:sugar nucleotide-binding protein [Algoriphagus halophilus]|uniref:sugar nucleotide-binding protein n=1 Tax=Algoriphagus halophilus TaxID=226505 RepID=UPI00358F88CA